MSQMNPKEFAHNTAYSVQLPYVENVYKIQPIRVAYQKPLKF